MLALIGERLALIGERLALIGERLALIGERLARIGGPVPVIGHPFAQVNQIGQEAGGRFPRRGREVRPTSRVLVRRATRGRRIMLARLHTPSMRRIARPGHTLSALLAEPASFSMRAASRPLVAG